MIACLDMAIVENFILQHSSGYLTWSLCHRDFDIFSGYLSAATVGSTNLVFHFLQTLFFGLTSLMIALFRVLKHALSLNPPC
ncbi:hypothetical protein PRUPE_1G112800 [Prunus persica]|uniref:Uncharacterized protein n=1 Tax=Prunus persica TaxID=3760 RepID=A0A251QYW5_PRUPE|nr:hypothetical protein PRUPE_1G112800 [Prunus persica]